MKLLVMAAAVATAYVIGFVRGYWFRYDEVDTYREALIRRLLDSDTEIQLEVYP